jgi:hypothetical protein
MKKRIKIVPLSGTPTKSIIKAQNFFKDFLPIIRHLTVGAGALSVSDNAAILTPSDEKRVRILECITGTISGLDIRALQKTQVWVDGQVVFAANLGNGTVLYPGIWIPPKSNISVYQRVLNNDPLITANGYMSFIFAEFWMPNYGRGSSATNPVGFTPF